MYERQEAQCKRRSFAHFAFNIDPDTQLVTELFDNMQSDAYAALLFFIEAFKDTFRLFYALACIDDLQR
jgi:hypothetical protein